MKLVILAGGSGTRLSEETIIKPKPLVEIGGYPIIWHIMKIYSLYGIKDFIVCCGYKGGMLKEYFLDYSNLNSDICVDFKAKSVSILKKPAEDWKITLVDTGLNTMTGGRIKKISKYLREEEDFCLTYGDGVANIDITKLIKFHKKHGKIATVTAVQPQGRYGALTLNKKKNDQIDHFIEKPKGDTHWINGGFFVLKKAALEEIKGDRDIWERKPLENLAKKNKLMAFKHYGFWQAMDTLSDKNYLNDLIKSKKAPWIKW